MWFIIEILLSLSILSSVLAGIYYLIPAFSRSTDVAKSQTKAINLKNALLNVYMDIAQAEQTCGYASCPATPLPCNISYTNGGISFSYVVSPSLNITSQIQGAFAQAGCSVSLISSTISIFCPSIKTSNIDFCSNTNYESYTFVNPNPNPIPSISFQVILQPDNPASPLSAPYIADYTPIYQYYQNQSISKFEQITSAMENYVLQRRTSEIANSCTWNGSDWVGGMESSYDFYIPWILQACTSTPNLLCSVSANAQVCSNSCTNITLAPSSQCNVNTLLSNLGLMSSTTSGYTADGFGNSITIIPFINGNSLPSQNPSYIYMQTCQSSGSFCPPFAGAITLSYTNLPCVSNATPYCYLQFTYP